MADIMERYSRNMNAFSSEDQRLVAERTICVVGCGGLGGHVAQTLARFGVGRLKLVDGDVFAVSNLNRQVFAKENTLGENKALVCAGALADINSDIVLEAIPEMLSEENAFRILNGCDLAIDCLDSRAARKLLDSMCAECNIPYIHGAIGGFYGQVSTIFPGDDTLAKIYGQSSAAGIEQELGNPAFIPQMVAAIQCCEALKVLCGKGETLRNTLMYIDLLYNDMLLIDL